MNKLPQHLFDSRIAVSHNTTGEVIMMLGEDDEIVFSARQALTLAKLLRSQALLAQKEVNNNHRDV